MFRNIMILFSVTILFTACAGKKVLRYQDDQGNARAVTGGDFNYFADAATFRPCGEGKVYPVSHDGAYLELERKYLKLKEGGQWLYVEVLGHFEKQKNAEGKVVQTFIIEKVIKTDETRVCGNEF